MTGSVWAWALKVNYTGKGHNPEHCSSLCVPLEKFCMSLVLSSSHNRLTHQEHNGKGNYASRFGGQPVLRVQLLKTALLLQKEVRKRFMKLNVCEIITVEGTEMELAFFTAVLLETFRMKSEADKKKEVDNWLKKYGDKTFDELMKMERDEEE